jgi:hypothetical protein
MSTPTQLLAKELELPERGFTAESLAEFENLTNGKMFPRDESASAHPGIKL